MEPHVEIINGTKLSELVDYSFGDHLGGLDPVNLIGGHMKLANMGNTEFLEKCKHDKTMTLFIDNIRLYNRPLSIKNENDAKWVNYLLANNDLLELCSKLPNKFIIFTSHEDTPIDEYIKVPENVTIYAVNALYNNERIHPFPIGVQRQIGIDDNRLEVLKYWVENSIDFEPTKLLYINCGLGAERNYEERAYLPTFEQYDWATCRFQAQSKFYPYEQYEIFLREIKDHKFMVCPKGHGADCHRNWESLYMRRVPVILDHPYFRLLMKDLPVLYVNKWEDITPELLEANNHLYEQAQKMDLSKLDLNKLYELSISGN